MVDYRPPLSDLPPIGEREPVTVAIPNFNGRHDLADAIRSAQNSTDPPAEILLVDDGSTDGSIAFVRDTFPDVRIIDLQTNSGGILNKVRNRALREARTRLVFLVDHDVVLAPTCVSALVSQMRALPDAGALTTRALYQHDPTRIYVDAQDLHYLCNAVATTRDRPVSDTDRTPRPSVGWGTMLVDKEKAALIGGFDEDYIIGWGDDGQFHHKLRLCGWNCYSVPDAIVYHKRVDGENRVYALTHNRWALIIETYALRTIVLLAPALVLYEAANFSFLVIKGKAGGYLRALGRILRHLPRLLRKRSMFQRLRRRPDRELLVGGPIYIRQSVLKTRVFEVGMRLLNRVFDGYWRLVRHAL